MEVLTITGGSLYTNCYMAWGEGDSCVLIDPGFDGNQILEQVRARGKQVEAMVEDLKKQAEAEDEMPEGLSLAKP